MPLSIQERINIVQMERKKFLSAGGYSVSRCWKPGKNVGSFLLDPIVQKGTKIDRIAIAKSCALSAFGAQKEQYCFASFPLRYSDSYTWDWISKFVSFCECVPTIHCLLGIIEPRNDDGNIIYASGLWEMLRLSTEEVSRESLYQLR